jgi:hypothetical protein
VYFILRAHVNLNAKFSLEIFHPNSDFTNLTVEIIDSHAPIISNALKHFLIIDSYPF